MKFFIKNALFICLLLFFARCTKDIGKLPISPENPLSSPAEETIDFSCVNFPDWFNPPPDSVTYPDKQIMYWQYRPGTKNEVVYTLNSQLWTYNFVTNQRHFITNNMQYLPDCNSRGWILFSDFRDQCVYKVKMNGDSLKRLTDGGLGGGHWDYTGTAIYYTMEGNNMLYKISENGNKLDSTSGVPVYFTAFSRKNDRLYYEKLVNGISSIVCFDGLTKTETVIATNAPSGRLTIDDKEENFYIRSHSDTRWAFIKYNIVSQRSDTLGKDCDNLLWTWPSISSGTNKVLIGCIFTKFLDPKIDPNIKKPKLLKWTKALEMDLEDQTNKMKAVNLFP